MLNLTISLKGQLCQRDLEGEVPGCGSTQCPACVVRSAVARLAAIGALPSEPGIDATIFEGAVSDNLITNVRAGKFVAEKVTP